MNNEIVKKVKDYSKNRSDLNTYFEVRRLLSLAGKSYGDGIVKQYSIKLTNELGKKYSTRLLYKTLKYYSYVSSQKLPTVSAQLSWSHYDELLKLNDINMINYYINVCINNNLSVRELREKIKSKKYERLDDKTKNKLINKEDISISDFIKNPIIIKNKFETDKISEKMLKELILDDISLFLKQIGDGFSFIDSEYKIKIGDNYNYIDLLLFNYVYNSFVVVELKVTELKKEHIGQIQVYMNYIDKNVKKINQDKTIGIIIVKKDNKLLIKYSSDTRIFETKYVLN